MKIAIYAIMAALASVSQATNQDMKTLMDRKQVLQNEMHIIDSQIMSTYEDTHPGETPAQKEEERVDRILIIAAVAFVILSLGSIGGYCLYKDRQSQLKDLEDDQRIRDEHKF